MPIHSPANYPTSQDWLFFLFSLLPVPGFKKVDRFSQRYFICPLETSLLSPLIEWVNGVIPFRIQRVIDYSDYWALLVLPVAHELLNRARTGRVYKNKLLHAGWIGVAGISFFAVCTTTVPPRMETPKGTIYIGKTYTIKKSKEEVVKMIRCLSYNVACEVHSTEAIARGSIMPYYYQTDNIVIMMMHPEW